MSRTLPLKPLVALALLTGSAGCSSDSVVFFQGVSPINAVAINERTIAPNSASFRITRGAPFNYTIETHYDIRPDVFHSAYIELAAFGGFIDDNGDFVETGTCEFRELRRHTPSTTSGDFTFTGSFTLPQTTNCASSTRIEFWVLLFSPAASGTSLDADIYRYQIN
jgi:hypothetical protein